MKVKRFVAPDMRQAIRWVREEQGSEAVILSTRRTDKGVEIVSAVDFDESVVQRLLDGARSAARGPDAGGQDRPVRDRDRSLRKANNSVFHGRPSRQRPASGEVPRKKGTRTESPEPARASGSAAGSETARTSTQPASGDRDEASVQAEQAIATLRSELRSMRGLLHSRLTALADNDYERREPIRARIARRLESFGLMNSTARAVADRVNDTESLKSGWREALAHLASRVPIAERDPMERGGRIALVGPSGVGKTVVARKMAETFARRHGRQSIALIATDASSLDAQRELIALGQSLGIYTLVAGGPAELREALDTVADRRLVLIDTAGISHRDPRVRELSRLLSGLQGVETWLVLAANSQRSVLEGTVRSFSALRPRGCVLTRVDECVGLGEPVDALIRSGLPVSHLSASHQSENRLTRAQGGRLVRLMVQLDEENRKRRTGHPGNKVKRDQSAMGAK